MNVISTVLVFLAIIFHLVKWIPYYGIQNLFITLFRRGCDLSHCQASPHLRNCLEINFNIILWPVPVPNWSVLRRFSNHSLILPCMVCVADISHPLWSVYPSSTRLYTNSPSWQVCPIQHLQADVMIVPEHQSCGHVLIHCISLFSGASRLTLYSLGCSYAYAKGNCELMSM